MSEFPNDSTSYGDVNIGRLYMIVGWKVMAAQSISDFEPHHHRHDGSRSHAYRETYKIFKMDYFKIFTHTRGTDWNLHIRQLLSYTLRWGSSPPYD